MYIRYNWNLRRLQLAPFVCYMGIQFHSTRWCIFANTDSRWTLHRAPKQGSSSLLASEETSRQWHDKCRFYFRILFFKFKLIDLVFAQGNYVAAASHYRHALCALGRTVPVSKIDVVACVVWNCWRQVLHRIGLTRFLSGRVGRFFISRDERRVAREFLAEAAICFHKLHQLHLSQKDIVDANSHYWWEI